MKGFHHGMGFSEEEALGKVYDRTLARRLLQYARPYYRHFILAIALTITAALVQIAQPYLIKIGIDRYIVHRYRVANLDELPAELQAAAREEADWKLDESRVVVDPQQIDPALRAQLERHNALGEKTLIPVDLAAFEPGERPRAEGLLQGLGDAVHRPPASALVLVELDALFTLEPGQIRFLRQGDMRGVARVGLAYFSLLGLAFVLVYSQIVLMAWIGQKIMCDIRNEVFAHVLAAPMRWLQRQPVGRLVTRTTNDVNTLNEMFTSILINLFQDATKLVGITAVMVYINWRLTLVTFSVLPLILVASHLFKVRMRAAYRDVRIKLARINAMLSEHLSGVRVVQLFRREEENARRFAAANREHFQANMRQLLLHALFSPTVAVLRQTGVALIITYGGGEVIRNTLQLGTLVAFLSYLEMLFQPILDLSEKYNIMQSAMAASERIFQILDQPVEEDEVPDPIREGTIQGKVSFENVSFAYNEGEYVLHDVTFTVEPGQTVALVGATGAGKTTVIKLLDRLYDDYQGTIRVDDIDIKQYARRFLRRQIAVVMQDVFLFSGDILTNIRLSEERITPERAQEIARYMNADHFIRALDGGYNAEVTPRGSTLSMGQRQLLAFARALAFDPRILVLDEATANIDTETEMLIQDALKKLMRGRTSIVIAHRLSTIQHADKILVFHKGRICESGSHKELLARRGLYYRLYKLQFEHQQTAAAREGS